jgi:hypothetical protein
MADDSTVLSRQWPGVGEFFCSKSEYLTKVAVLASALLLLAGVYLVNTANGTGRSTATVLALLAVMQLYEAVLIGGAWFLIRRLRHVKSGLALVVLEVLFMPDIAFFTDSLPSHGVVALPVMGAWVALSLVKAGVIARMLGLRLSRSAFVLLGVGAVFIVAVPLVGLRLVISNGHLPYVIAAGIFILFLLHRWCRPRISGGIAGVSLNPAVDSFIRRVWLVWLCLIGLHLFNWHYTMVPVSPVYLTAALAIGSLYAGDHRGNLVLLALAAIVCAHAPSLAWVGFGLCLSASVFLFATTGSQRFLTAAMFFAYGAAWSLIRASGLTGSGETAALALADAALASGGVLALSRTRYWPHALAVLGGAAGVFRHLKLGAWIDSVFSEIAGLGRSTLGTALIVFAFLVLGTLIFWHSRVRLEHEHPPE